MGRLYSCCLAVVSGKYIYGETGLYIGDREPEEMGCVGVGREGVEDEKGESQRVVIGEGLSLIRSGGKGMTFECYSGEVISE